MSLLLDTKKYLVQLSIVFVVLGFGLFAIFTDSHKVHAQDSNFTDGITVDSKLDTADTNVGDNICDDGSGNCTLRAAIEESNATTGTQTINFNITGTSDFTNGGQNGYTIQPTSGLPSITDTVNIDGYTQPGAQANTAIAPNPLNGRLLIELDGSGAGTVNGLNFRADNIVIRGLVINNFGEDAVDVDDDNSVIAGNYLGTEPDGVTAAPNDNLAIGTGIGTTDGLRIGGLVPADRNLVSGNGTGPQGGGISPNTGHNNWTIQGNYIGVDKTGLVALGNAQPGGSGSLSLDNSDGHIVGGSQPGAINVISGNLGHGIAPHNVDNVQIIGNYIGVGYDGVTSLGNGYSGITLSDCVNMLIEDNIIANSGNAGIGLYEDSVGTQIYGNTIYNNEQGGIMVFGASNTQIGTASQGNVIHDNIGYNIAIHAINLMGILTDNTRIQGNIIKDSQLDVAGRSTGITVTGDSTNTLIGGSGAGEGNIIRDNNGAGIVVQELNASAISLIITPSNASILGNSISGTLPIGGLFGANSLGIDILSSTDTTGPTPDGIPESYTNLGPTPNDATDSDTGPNNYMNFPVINSAAQNNNQLTVDLNLDAADTTDAGGNYRVEFFANDSADPSGYGEGQTYLGSANITNGNNQTANITLPANTNLTGKVLSATTTAMNNAAPSGFGSTSEFSEISPITVLSTTTPDQLASTGENLWLWLVGALSLVGVGVYMARVVGRR